MLNISQINTLKVDDFLKKNFCNLSTDTLTKWKLTGLKFNKKMI